MINITASIEKIRKEHNMNEREKNDKFTALKNYIYNYDYQNLSILMFPKEDGKWLYEACAKQTAEHVMINKNDKNILYCPKCEREYRKGYDLYCSGCGQKLKYNGETQEMTPMNKIDEPKYCEDYCPIYEEIKKYYAVMHWVCKTA